ncbi:hypothetical protein MHI22_05160 [Lysinibacillus sp. FSL L8-0312]|uniref:hypothetical protein n=1 Tax=Lysinibacillus sp. FSL L8-0312 TaxID=2921521 RepID=UPI0030FB0710
MDIIDFVGYTFSSGIIVVWIAEKVERVVKTVKFMFGESFDEAITVVMKVVPKKKEHDELEV